MNDENMKYQVEYFKADNENILKWKVNSYLNKFNINDVLDVKYAITEKTLVSHIGGNITDILWTAMVVYKTHNSEKIMTMIKKGYDEKDKEIREEIDLGN